MPAIIDVRYSLGAILIGCFIAVACVVCPHFYCPSNPTLRHPPLRFSGIVAFQACIYFRMYPKDKPLNKLMVRRPQLLCTNHLYEPISSVGRRGLVSSETCFSRSIGVLSSRICRLLDALHTCLICTSVWKYLIANFGNVQAHERGDVPV
jgi:hypothetical protein